MAQVPAKQLLVSIHDVGPGYAAEVDRLAALLEELLGGLRLAMLVVPDHWGAHPLAADSTYRARLRDWSDRGVEMFVHGWYHRDIAHHSGIAGLKARAMTAGEGEFLGLPEDVALRRMRDGKALLEEITGREVAGFVAPAWLYGPGALRALERSGFALAEDHFKVWRPGDGAVLARGPVITWASRSTARTASSLAFAALARRALRMLPVVRIGVHPGDVTKSSILSSINATVRAFAKERSVGRYCGLAGVPTR